VHEAQATAIAQENGPAAALADAMREGGGHVAVVGESARAAAALFDAVEPQVVAYRSLRVRGSALDGRAALAALCADKMRPGDAWAEQRAALRALATEACAAGQPVLVVVAEADAASAEQLEEFRQAMEAVPEAQGAVRLVLLGGPRLGATLERPQARALAARIGARIVLPEVALGEEPAIVRPRRGWRYVAVGAVALALSGWWVGTSHDRDPVVPAASERLDPASPERSAVREPEAESGASPVPVPAPPPGPPAPATTAVAPTMARVPERPPPRPGGLALQVGAFRNAENAEALRRRLAQDFARVYVTTVERDGGTYHRVLVGGFASERERSAAAAALRSAGYAPLAASPAAR
jgi:cell division septation protein DedD